MITATTTTISLVFHGPLQNTHGTFFLRLNLTQNKAAHEPWTSGCRWPVSQLKGQSGLASPLLPKSYIHAFFMSECTLWTATPMQALQICRWLRQAVLPLWMASNTYQPPLKPLLIQRSKQSLWGACSTLISWCQRQSFEETTGGAAMLQQMHS